MKKIPQFIVFLSEDSMVWNEPDAQLINGARSTLLARSGKFNGRSKLRSAKFGRVQTPRGERAIIINYSLKNEDDVVCQVIYFKGTPEEFLASK
jgi:hypothetical protein